MVLNSVARNAASATIESRFPKPVLSLARAITLLALILLVYWRILGRLVQEWWFNPNFSHGFLVPIFVAFVIWQERDRLKQIEIHPSWIGLGVIAGALGILAIGVLGAEEFSSRASLVFVLAGLVIYFLGWSWFRALLFPLGCLFLMIPIPAILFNHLTLPMQLFASQFANSLLSMLGVPVLREGNVLYLPTMALQVAEACSGIRSLMALVTLSIVYGYLFEKRALRRFFLALAALPIAIIANGLRIVGTGLVVQYVNPGLGEGFFHSFEGWVIFLISTLCLVGVHASFSGFDRVKRRISSR